eukprot:GHVS01003763.1.p1 GENE.GHVS01003763.1~~GHVS01003763.1.p1  ORF type:complete len:373 (+),score=31.23 GHVS01003763.1:187-1305(+)
MLDINIFHWNYQSYNAITLVLSSFIIAGLFIFQMLVRHDSLLAVTFHCIRRSSNRRLLCYDTDITLSPDGLHVKNYLMWLQRTVIVVVMCYLWQTCIFSYRALNLHYVSYRQLLRRECVEGGADCFGASQPWYFFVFWALPDELCNGLSVDATDGDILNYFIPSYSYAICIRWIAPDTLLYTTNLAIAFSLTQMIIILSEVMIWILLETNWYTVWSGALWVVSAIFLAFWMTSIFVGVLFPFFTSWLGFVELLSVPLVLFCCRVIANSLRKIKGIRVQVWAAKADKPISHLAEEHILLNRPSSIANFQQLGSSVFSQRLTSERSMLGRSNFRSALAKRSMMVSTSPTNSTKDSGQLSERFQISGHPYNDRRN